MSENDSFRILEDALTGRDWAIAQPPSAEFVPLNPDPMIQAKLAYERARSAGCLEEILVELGKKYVDLRDARTQSEVPAVSTVKTKPRASATRRAKVTA